MILPHIPLLMFHFAYEILFICNILNIAPIQYTCIAYIRTRIIMLICLQHSTSKGPSTMGVNNMWQQQSETKNVNSGGKEGCHYYYYREY